MTIKTIMKNLWNSVDSENVAFWSQMREFYENGLKDFIPLAIYLNDNWLDSYEVD